MPDPLVRIQLVDRPSFYLPGDVLTASYAIEQVELAQLQAIEASVLWYTEGTGDEDLLVHYFERFTADAGNLGPVGESRQFTTRLPNSPLTYEGLIVKICWCVRVRAFLARGKNTVAEQSFQLGTVPVAQLVTP